jgi:hypothetical protein
MPPGFRGKLILANRTLHFGDSLQCAWELAPLLPGPLKKLAASGSCIYLFAGKSLTATYSLQVTYGVT